MTDVETGRDVHLAKWLDSRFEQLREQIERLGTGIEKAELAGARCREHCDTAMDTVYQRIAHLEQVRIGEQAREELRRVMDTRIEALEDRRVQQGQRLWIALGAGASGAAALFTLGAYFSRYLMGLSW